LESFTRIQRTLAILSQYPDGLSLDDLADELGVAVAQLRREILQYYGTDIDSRYLMGLQRHEVIEFVSADGAEADPHLAPVVRLASDAPESELGVRYIRADQLAVLYDAGRSLLDVEPDNEALASAVDRLGRTFLAAGGADPEPDGTPALLRSAIESRTPLRIEYSREWRPGVGNRVVHPYALHRTRRGWELDAGPLDGGRARTFIVSRIRSAEPLTGEFARPPGIEAILHSERQETRVELSLPQGSHWAADRFAERTEVIDADADDLTLAAWFLPPVAERVGLVLLIAGRAAFVVDPPGLGDAAAGLARSLRRHHGLPGRP
jgi:proteasome accessory factor C